MTRLVRAGLTQTRNAYAAMPERVGDLDQLAGRLDALRDANLEHHVELLREARRLGCAVVGLGELFAGPYFALEERALWRELAEDAFDGPSVRAVSSAARELSLIVVAPIYELDRASGKRFNTAVVIDEAGRVLGRYRKMHIPCGTNERAGFHETSYYERSDGNLGNLAENVLNASEHFPVFRTSIGALGVSICYDRHFEGVHATLAAGGAELVLSPAVTFGAQSRRMWELEFAVDAARHGLYIGGSNRLGCEPPFDVEYYGASHFVGPRGRLADLSDRPELVVSELDLDALAGGDGSGWDLERDSRPETYER